MEFKILSNAEINKTKWDACVQQWAQSPIYNCSAYLDALSANWSAIVGGDYDVLMALPIKSKLGFTILNTPSFIQKIAIISKEDPAHYEQQIWQIIQQQFSLIDINVELAPSGIANTQRKNFILPLHLPYEGIAKQYTTLCKRNLKKAGLHNFTLENNVDVQSVLNTFVTFYKDKMSYTDVHMEHLLQFCRNYPEHIQTFGVVHEGKLVYSCLCLKDDKRLYYLISGATEDALQLKATYWCMDQIIKTYANTHYIFDFEGSEIADIAFYYSRFNPQTEWYFNIKQNKLPWGMKQLMKQKLGY